MKFELILVVTIFSNNDGTSLSNTKFIIFIANPLELRGA